MPQTLRAMLPWLHRRCENIIALMLGTMFIAFLLQIVFRYGLNLSIGWTHELSVMMWIWIVLFGSAFVLREDEEVRFDIVYAGLPQPLQRACRAITALIVAVVFAVSLPAVYDYVSFMKVEKTSYLHVRFDYLYSIYVVFAVAMIARYGWRAFCAITGRGAVSKSDAEGSEKA